MVGYGETTYGTTYYGRTSGITLSVTIVNLLVHIGNQFGEVILHFSLRIIIQMTPEQVQQIIRALFS